MNLELTAEAVAFGRDARQAFGAAGGDALIQAAEADPAGREALVEPVLKELGAWELAPRADADELEAAAVLCRSAGYWGLPYPVAERLARPTDLDVDGLLVVADASPRGAVSDLELRWAAVTLDGDRSLAWARPAAASPRTSAFVCGLDLRPVDDGRVADVALALILPCWTLLGMLDRALDLAREHVLVRTQFGRPLADFQGVQFPLTDAEVERSGLDVLARYALWSAQNGGSEALVDAVALRVAAIEAAELVFRVAHQVHGAIGFCDEVPLSWLSRYSRPLRELPYGACGSRDRLARLAARDGFAGLFG
ncbi:acyl-CoA dehydrogenase family protein [Cryptosporangium phraense]|uniref:Acyl-CoA dehydrogenase n=1 Tax=Cryptosporangium phraense TaxID=2593070 RepID=A0A545APT1_9ACTN|nr:acyl-CoA dehydrogenase family protein [Cryptosporangium phraense]TQS43324.1 acyl-CoA dehydrogenase [Cryptosporangium phraense]